MIMICFVSVALVAGIALSVGFSEANITCSNAFPRSEVFKSSNDHKILGKAYMFHSYYDWAITQFEMALRYHPAQHDAELLMLLASAKEAVDERAEAIDLYYTALHVDPTNALAHERIGLIYLGMAPHNFGAPLACGLNHNLSVLHLKTALHLDPTLNPSFSTLTFCIQEIHQVQQWRTIVSQLKADKLSTVDAVPTRLRQKVTARFGNWIRNVTAPVVTRVKKRFRREQGPKILNKTEIMMQHWAQRASEMDCSSIDAVNWSHPGVPVRFYKHFIAAQRPALIRDFQREWNASIFTPTNLALYFGQYMVRVHVSQSGRFDGPERGGLWGLQDDTEVLVRPAATSMLLGDFLYLVQHQTENTTEEVYYIEYLALHQYLGQTFLDLVPLPHMLRHHPHLKHRVTNLWIGGAPTVSPLHCDDFDNFLCQVQGQKEVILFPPSDEPYLYYLSRALGRLRYTHPGQFTRDATSVDRRRFVFGSSVHVDSPDLLKHPLFEHSTPRRVVLQAGDVLFIPARWHHEVQSLPDAVTGLNVAVNFWFDSDLR